MADEEFVVKRNFTLRTGTALTASIVSYRGLSALRLLHIILLCLCTTYRSAIHCGFMPQRHCLPIRCYDEFTVRFEELMHEKASAEELLKEMA